jgi:Holliday junction resolvasome RuvABC DNA-binding subunit
MRAKREAAQCAAEARRKEAEARARAAAEEVIAPLRSLGFRADEARQAAALCESIPEASLEHRVRRALTYFHPPRTSAQAARSLECSP